MPHPAQAAPEAAAYPNLSYGGEHWSPERLRQRVEEVARGLVAAGVGSGDVVALMLRNEPAFAIVLLACRRIGAYPCAINWHFKDAETRHILSDSGAKVLFVHEDLVAQARAALEDTAALKVVVATHPKLRSDHGLEPHAAAPKAWARFPDFGAGADVDLPDGVAPRGLMAYTSGTTGLPKGVKRLPRSPQEQAAAAPIALAMSRQVFGVHAGARCLLVAPLYHSAPCAYFLFAASEGAHIVLESRFDVRQTLASIQRERITHLYLVPTMYRRLLQLDRAERSAFELGSVEFVASTGSPCPPETKRAMIDWWGAVIHESYASSETGYLSFISADDWLHKPGSAGRAAIGARLAVVRDDGTPCAPGEVGTIYGRQASTPDFTYQNNDAARRASALGDLITVGDVGWFDADGYLFLSDRKSDMVISGGVNIYPAEIEQCLAGLPVVADCAVFGIPDEDFGEALAAAVQRLPGVPLSEAQVRDFLKARLADYKVPRVVSFHEQLPREDTGKIFKRQLRAPYWAQVQRHI